MVHLVLHPHRIATTFLKLASWSPGAGFIPIISTKGINKINRKETFITKLSFMCTKRFIIFFKRWVQFRVGAIPRLIFNGSVQALVLFLQPKSLIFFRIFT